jgi:hypothetical protein
MSSRSICKNPDIILHEKFVLCLKYYTTTIEILEYTDPTVDHKKSMDKESRENAVNNPFLKLITKYGFAAEKANGHKSNYDPKNNYERFEIQISSFFKGI